MNKTIYRIVIILVVVFSISMVSCSVNRLTKEEAVIVEKYTKDNKHDMLIIGEWINNESWEHKGKTNKVNISFDEQGIKRERMYRDGEPFNDWHLVYYYYTEQGKIFTYRPAEKGFLGMNGELFFQTEYQFSEDGRTLFLGDKSYKKLQ